MSDKAALYVQSPILGQRYSQVKIGPSSFSSAKSHRVMWEPRCEFGYASLNDKASAEASTEYFSCRMTYPSALSGHSTGTLQPQRDPYNPTKKLPQGRPPLPLTRDDRYRSLQQPNVYWMHPPPTDTPLSDRRDEAEIHEKVPMHPLLSRLQGAENAKAAQFNPTVAVLASPSGRHAPREQRLAERDTEDGVETSMQDTQSLGTLAQTQASIQQSSKDMAQDAISKEYTAEGGLHDPDHYRSNIINFATSQPNSLSSIAAKAITRAIHGTSPSHAIPCNAAISASFRPTPNSGPTGTNANRYEHAGLHNARNHVMPPSAAFRNLSPELQSILLQPRTARTRGVIQSYLNREVPPMQPPPPDGVEAEESDGMNLVHQRTSVSMAIDDAEEEPEPNATTDVLLTSPLAVWNHVQSTKGLRLRKEIDETEAPGPTSWVTGGKKVHEVIQGSASCFHRSSPKPMFATYLASVGLRRGASITMPMPPTDSNFSKKPAHIQATADAMKKYPCNSFALDDTRLLDIVREGSGEVEQVWLEGLSWLSESSFVAIGELCPNLKMLNASGCVNLAEEGIVAIARGCPTLALLDLSGCTAVTPTALAEVFGKCTDLMAVSLHNVPFSDFALGSVFQCLNSTRNLASLDISYCPGVTDSALLCLAKYCPGLEMLDISGCVNITDIGLASVGSSCGLLSVLKLKLCSQQRLTKAGLRSITIGPHNLKHLDMSGCTQLENDTLAVIVERSPTLLELGISGCIELTDEAILSVAKHCKSLQRLDLSSCKSVSLGSCMDLIHDLVHLHTLVVSESSISNAEVVMLSSIRDGCRITRNQHRMPPPNHIVCVKLPDKQPKPDPKNDPKKKKK
eukprot:PhM_4_TR18269/c0_g1_i1/m.51676/K10268/FBXL2_20; F-box and leucine-rich repeat protein 2/20